MNRKKKLGWWKHIDFMLIDLLCIQIAYLAAYFFRHQTMRIYRETSLYAHVNILLIIIDICYVLLRGTYKNILKRSFVREIESVLVHNIVMWVCHEAGILVFQTGISDFLWFYGHLYAGRTFSVENECSPHYMERKESTEFSGYQYEGICSRNGEAVFQPYVQWI